TIDHDELAGTRGLQMHGGLLGHVPRTDDEYGATDELAEDARRQIDRDGRDARRPSCDFGFAAYPFGALDRERHASIEHGADRPALLGLRVGGLHLAEDLRLADHHRLEAGGDAKNVPRGVGLRSREDVALERARVDRLQTRELHERRRRWNLPRGHPVDFHAVARRHEHHLVQPGVTTQLLQHASEVVRADGEALAQLHGRTFVIETESDELRHERTPYDTTMRRIAANATKLSHADCRPRVPHTARVTRIDTEANQAMSPATTSNRRPRKLSTPLPSRIQSTPVTIARVNTGVTSSTRRCCRRSKPVRDMPGLPGTKTLFRKRRSTTR